MLVRVRGGEKLFILRMSYLFMGSKLQYKKGTSRVRNRVHRGIRRFGDMQRRKLGDLGLRQLRLLNDLRKIKAPLSRKERTALKQSLTNYIKFRTKTLEFERQFSKLYPGDAGHDRRNAVFEKDLVEIVSKITPLERKGFIDADLLRESLQAVQKQNTPKK